MIKATARILIRDGETLARWAMITAAANAGKASNEFNWAKWALLGLPWTLSKNSRGLELS